ncbi:MAG TPA: phytanoyl-CoA dioxygenase family protein [Solirubrobacteraceae bacterium]|jgi:ectoine hydroxylase-related dioxygenase (phytanoyl-CoA dioxygenase family)|nr:phytanoyl-CoA dioxygenase family protein [Solirubrobacteraceae bacterium]
MSESTSALRPAQLELLPSDDDVRFYEEHGWWISPPILTDEEIEEAAFGVERYYAGERDTPLLMEAGTDWRPERGNILRQNDYVSLQVDELRQLVKHPLVAATAARLARTPEVRLFHDQLIYKPPQVDPSVTNVGWHTDIAYWKTCSSRNMLTAWIPFQDVTPEMGPMLVVDGSHRWSENDELEFFHETNLDAVAERIVLPDATMKPVPILLERGQVSFHHCRAIHGSEQNRSDRARLALAVHMQDADNRYVRTTDENGKPRSHLNDFMVRRDADGNPDYTDPEVCPVLWREAA